MNFVKIIYCLCLIIISTHLNAQDENSTSEDSQEVSLGLGAGLNYGGLGTNLLIYVNKQFGFFAGGGYALAGFGYNVGTKFRFISEKSTKFNPYLMAMYGYNAAIVVTNESELNELFYGPTFGVGFERQLAPGKSGYWSFALLVPIRNSKVDAYIDDLRINNGVVLQNDLLPIGLAVGYHFVIN